MILETKRTILRPFTESDAEDVYAYRRVTGMYSLVAIFTDPRKIGNLVNFVHR